VGRRNSKATKAPEGTIRRRISIRRQWDQRKTVMGIVKGGKMKANDGVESVK